MTKKNNMTIDTEKILYEQLLKLAEMDVQLEKDGGFKKNGELYEEIMLFKDEILDLLELPKTPDNVDLLHFNGLPSKKEVWERIDKIKQVHHDYLARPFKSKIEILKEAKENQEKWAVVLPELRVHTHVYTIYVYNFILLGGVDTPENVLAEFELIQQNCKANGDLLNRLGMLYVAFERADYSTIRHVLPQMENSNLKYYYDFLVFLLSDIFFNNENDEDDMDKRVEQDLRSIKEKFEEYFSNWKIKLPDKNLNERLNGYLNNSGWLIQYCFGIENDIEYLDFYASHRMTADRHVRIYENGEIERLPSYWEFFVVDSEGRGKKEYEENSKKVTKLLIEKGFDKFTTNMALKSGILEE